MPAPLPATRRDERRDTTRRDTTGEATQRQQLRKRNDTRRGGATAWRHAGRQTKRQEPCRHQLRTQDADKTPKPSTTIATTDTSHIICYRPSPTSPTGILPTTRHTLRRLESYRPSPTSPTGILPTRTTRRQAFCRRAAPSHQFSTTPTPPRKHPPPPDAANAPPASTTTTPRQELRPDDTPTGTAPPTPTPTRPGAT